jgi:hypothetical protein
MLETNCGAGRVLTFVVSAMQRLDRVILDMVVRLIAFGENESRWLWVLRSCRGRSGRAKTLFVPCPPSIDNLNLNGGHASDFARRAMADMSLLSAQRADISARMIISISRKCRVHRAE